MKSILRSLLVCFLLLALPFQAFASASMRPPAAAPAHAATAAALPPCHQQVANQLGEHLREQVRHQASHDCDASQHAKGKCGSCAACHVGAAMASGASVAPALAPPRFVSIPFRAGYLPSVDPVLPERPPSTLRA